MSKDSIILERRFVPKGTLVMRQGDQGNSAYLIQSGSVSVYADVDEKRIELAKLDMGQIFGEMALIFDDPRTASVEALEDCNLIVITRQTFKQKLDRSDPTIRAIVVMLTQRIVTANNAMLAKKGNLDDLVDTSKIIYDNVFASLPATQKRTFENSVLPKLQEFMGAIKSFQDRFSGKE
ncbi:MAG: cyclic nucleotide-binding domain-containing protein [Alphaproteobacteria bacterium]|nr:cyclic nucleotide-binding domain-containing protein [Alphaproteobacteria bacterium]MCD8570806.1 cyclic nucleotide-binding domain-containing protein [Alphaproteobacteria bacterium]